MFAEVVISRHNESVLKPCPWTREQTRVESFLEPRSLLEHEDMGTTYGYEALFLSGWSGWLVGNEELVVGTVMQLSRNSGPLYVSP